MQSQPADSLRADTPSPEPLTELRIPREPDPREVLDDDKRRAILRLISNGNSRRAAARFVGCSPSTITRTAQRDPDFAEQLALALDHVQRECLYYIRTAAEGGNWRAAAWLLERSNPDDFGKRAPRTLTPDDVTSLLHQFVAALAPDMSQEDHDRLRTLADQWIRENLDDPAPIPQSQPEPRTENSAQNPPLSPSAPNGHYTERLESEQRHCQDRELCRQDEREADCLERRRRLARASRAPQDDDRAPDIDPYGRTTPLSWPAVPTQPAPFPSQSNPARTPDPPPTP